MARLRKFDLRGWTAPGRTACARARRQHFADEFGGTGFPVVKDPRMCRLMPFWAPEFDEADGRSGDFSVDRGSRSGRRSIAATASVSSSALPALVAPCPGRGGRDKGVGARRSWTGRDFWMTGVERLRGARTTENDLAAMVRSTSRTSIASSPYLRAISPAMTTSGAPGHRRSGPETYARNDQPG